MAKRKTKRTCALCLCSKVLAKSHIISGFHARKLHKKRKKGEVISLSEKGRGRTYPGGHWQHLLCHECDNALGDDTELAASRIFYHGEPELLATSEHGNIFGGIDYKALRLYALSTLWKMSISSKPYFSHVSLSLEDNEQLRKAILERQTLDGLYPVVFSLVMNGEVPLHANINPLTLESEDLQSIVVVTNGIMMECFIRGYEKIKSVQNLAIAPHGELGIPEIQLSEISFLQDHFSKIREANENLDAPIG